MNKVISLGLFALMLSTFSGQLFAGDATLCDPLKQGQNKSLYGLCVAWHHADEDAKKKELIDPMQIERRPREVTRQNN